MDNLPAYFPPQSSPPEFLAKVTGCHVWPAAGHDPRECIASCLFREEGGRPHVVVIGLKLI